MVSVLVATLPTTAYQLVPAFAASTVNRLEVGGPVTKRVELAY